MKKFNIIMTLVAVTLTLFYTYMKLPRVDKEKSNTVQTESTTVSNNTIRSSVTKTVQRISKPETVEVFRNDTKSAISISNNEIESYNESANEDEEIYNNQTVVVSTDKDYDKFFTKMKDSIVEIKNGNTTFYGVVTKNQKGIYVITDRSTATDSPKVTIKNLAGQSINIDSVKSCNKLISFKLKAPFPPQLKPVQASHSNKTKRTLSLGAFSFDYGDEPELTIGKGTLKKDGTCEISAQLRRCRPGTPLFTTKGTLYGITTWNPSGNIGTALGHQTWNTIKYPFKVASRSVKRSKYKSSRYN